jgi:hypothetical protein
VIERAVPVFAATVYDNCADPVRLLLPAMVIQAGTPATLHEQPGTVVTDSVFVAPAAVTETVAGVTVYVQDTPCCVTVNVRPAIATVPVRCDVAGFAAIVTLTVPFPLPLAPAVTVIHPALLTAVHAQPEVEVTLTLVDSPAAGVVRLAGLIAYVQACTPLWVIVKVRPAMVRVPVLAVVAECAATEYPTEPEPVPDAPEVTVIQVVFAAAVHVQLVPAVTETLPVDAVAATVVAVVESDGAQGLEVVNGLDNVLGAVPPGPTADTRA